VYFKKIKNKKNSRGVGKTHPTQKQKKKKAKRQHSLKGKISHKLLPRPHLPPEREREREKEEEEQERGLLLYSAVSTEHRD
jgi:hypothetical protein